MYKKARAKINLTLNVLNKREDSYHNLESVFQKISLYDELYVTKTDKHNGINITPEIVNLKKEDNIIFKAYEILKNNYKEITGVDVVLKKYIPMQAGIGGGSADCGAFIECMNELFKLKLTKSKMIEIGTKLGADVPASLYDKPILARGIGEKIEEIDAKFKFYLVIVKPEFSCNTKEMFEILDAKKEIIQKYNSEKMEISLKNKDIKEISNNLYNIFENAIENIDKIKNDIIKAGAIGSLLAGSGSCVFGIFESKEKAKLGYKILKEKYSSYYCISFSK